MPTEIEFPVLPLRDIVVFPLATMPLLVGRARSLKACGEALAGDGRILLIAQRDAAADEPAAGDLYGMGVVATIVQHLSADGRMKLLVRGEQRARIVRVIDDPLRFRALAAPIDPPGGEAQPPDAPAFSLAGWANGAITPVARPVALLQAILEDESLEPIERLRAARSLIGGG